VLAAVFRLDAELHAATVRGGFADRDVIQFVKKNKEALA
jgi:hypothetical protein